MRSMWMMEPLARGDTMVKSAPWLRRGARANTKEHEAPFGAIAVLPRQASGPVIARANDPAEAEADRAADQVTRGGATPQLTASAPSMQRKCAACDQEEMLQRKGHGSVQPGAATAPPIVGEVLRAPGRPLDPVTRGFMEQRFGYDFSRVRVHADGAASRSAEAVAARAYTVGTKVVFRQGEYSPESADGRRLLAHELAHVVQQSKAGSPAVQREPDQKSRAEASATPASGGPCYTCDVAGGQLGICCYGPGAPMIPECLDLGKSIVDGCKEDKQTCLQQAQCAQCKCIARKAGREYCQCTGMV